jgi:hypothetical protein
MIVNLNNLEICQLLEFPLLYCSHLYLNFFFPLHLPTDPTLQWATRSTPPVTSMNSPRRTASLSTTSIQRVSSLERVALQLATRPRETQMPTSSPWKLSNSRTKKNSAIQGINTRAPKIVSKFHPKKKPTQRPNYLKPATILTS